MRPASKGGLALVDERRRNSQGTFSGFWSIRRYGQSKPDASGLHKTVPGRCPLPRNRRSSMRYTKQFLIAAALVLTACDETSRPVAPIDEPEPPIGVRPTSESPARGTPTSWT